MIFSIFILAAFIAVAQAGCDNSCSGHGVCGERGICECYDNWGLGLGQYSGDCSQRICPYEIAFVDSPYLESTYRKGLNYDDELALKDDNTNEIGNYGTAGSATSAAEYKSVARHRYAECSGRGICNRDSGECECFPGYEGKGCQRTACPNDCSGHGRCAYIEHMPFETTAMDAAPHTGDWSFLSQDAHTFDYYGWDRHKTRGCICDPEYGDFDCSKRMCPYGTDVMDQRNDMTRKGKYEVQSIFLQARGYPSAPGQNDGANAGGLSDTDTVQGRTFALTFKSKLNETFTTNPIVFKHNPATTDLRDFILDVEQALESLPNRVIDDVKVHAAFYKGGATPALNAIRLNITFSGEHVQGPQNLLTVRAYNCDDGCTPKLTGLDLEPNHQAVRVGWVNFQGEAIDDIDFLTATADEVPTATTGTGGHTVPVNIGNYMSDFNSYECGRRGKCNYDTGVCACHAGYTGVACGTITALV